MQELIELIHDHDFMWQMSDDQRRWDHGYEQEKRIRALLKDITFEDIEDHVKEEWRKDALKKLF